MKASIVKDSILSAAEKIAAIEHETIQLQHRLNLLSQRASRLRNIVRSLVCDLNETSHGVPFPRLLRVDNLLIDIGATDQECIRICKAPAALRNFDSIPLS